MIASIPDAPLWSLALCWITAIAVVLGALVVFAKKGGDWG